MTEVILGVITLVVLVLFAWREDRHHQERRDLYTRLMAKDLTEYQAVTSTVRPTGTRNPIKKALEQAEKNKAEV